MEQLLLESKKTSLYCKENESDANLEAVDRLKEFLTVIEKLTRYEFVTEDN